MQHLFPLFGEIPTGWITTYINCFSGNNVNNFIHKRKTFSFWIDISHLPHHTNSNYTFKIVIQTPHRYRRIDAILVLVIILPNFASFPFQTPFHGSNLEFNGLTTTQMRLGADIGLKISGFHENWTMNNAFENKCIRRDRLELILKH